MSITVNTNVASLIAQKSLNNATIKMNTAMERLSTGLRINSSKDDAAGSAVSTKLEYKVSSLNVAGDNAQMGSSLLDTEEGTLDVIQSNMTRIRDLTEQAANGTYGTDAMTAIKSEIAGRLAEVTRIAGTTEFNGKKLLDGSMDNGINLQVGITSGDDSVINLQGSLFASTTAESLLGDYTIKGNGDGSKVAKGDTPTANVITFNSDANARIGNDYYKVDGTAENGNKKLVLLTGAELKTAQNKYKDELGKGTPDIKNSNEKFSFQNDSVTGAKMKNNAVNNLDEVFRNDITAQAFLDNVDSALANVIDRKTEIGATQQRIASAMEVTNIMSTNFTSVNSLIKDADIAEESSSYIKNQILQQTASSLLATANQNPSIAMSLV